MAKHVDKGYVLLKKYRGLDNVLVNIRRTVEYTRPDKYEISLFKCGFNVKDPIQKPFFVEWDEYQKFLLDWIDGTFESYTKKEACLLIWEIFVADNDYKLSNSNFKDTLYKSIDVQENFDDRMEAINFISNNVATWMLPLYNRVVSNYCDWLNLLINAEFKNEKT
jgi:hypothetical protein